MSHSAHPAGRRVHGLLFVAALLATSPGLQAMMQPHLDLPWLADNSQDIVRGEVVAAHCERRHDIPGVRELIVTVFTLRVAESYKGGLQPSALTEFTILGGELGGEANRVSNMPEDLSPGSRGIFFLRDWEGLRVPAGWVYGCALFADTGGKQVRIIDRDEPTDQLLQRLQTLLARQ